MDCRIFVRGEVDIANAAELSAQLTRAIDGSEAQIVLDCAHMTFLDSTGIRCFVDAFRTLELKGRHLRVVNVQRAPRRAIEFVGLADLLLDDGLISN